MDVVTQPKEPRGTTAWVVVSVGAVILLFIASTEYVWHRSAEIGVAADSIAVNASPSIQDIAAARAALKDLILRIDQYLLTADGTPADLSGVEQARRDLNAQTRAYLELPTYPGERDLWSSVDRDLGNFDFNVNAVLELAHHGDIAAARIAAAGPLHDAEERTAASMLAVIRFNAAQSQSLATGIAITRTRARRNLNVLESVSTLLSIIVAWFALRALRRYQSLLRSHRLDALARADEQGQFAARVAHDIRSPLATVSLTLQQLERDEADDHAAVSRTVARGRRALDRATRIVDGLFDFARAGARPAPDARAHAASVVQELIEDLRPDAAAIGVELQVEHLPSIDVACSPGVLTSALANLLRNALKYIQDSPERRITVRVLERGTRARFEVEDTGPGLPDALREKIFDPYVRAPGTSQPGLGLGLATVRRLCEGHGGAVGEEPGPGGGSRFWFEMPRCDAEGLG